MVRKLISQRKFRKTLYCFIFSLPLWEGLGLSFLSSCQQTYNGYYHYTSVPSNWENTHQLCIPLDTIAQTITHPCFLTVRKTQAYPYQSLWLKVQWQLHRPDTLMIDTVQCKFISTSDTDKTGLTFQSTEAFMGQHTLQKGQYGQITIQHIMRHTPLSGISEVGIKIN